MVIEKLKRSFYELYYIKKSIETLNKNIELLKKLEKTAEIRYQVGQGVQQDVWKAQLEISKLIERLEILKRMQGTTIAVINSILNRPADAPMGEPMDFDKTSFSYSLEDLLKMAEDNSPELKKNERIIEREKYNLTYSKLQYLPNFSLNFGFGERGSLDTLWVAGIGVEVPLYFWRKQSAGVREARWRVSSAVHSLQNVKETLFAEIRSAYLDVTTADGLLNLYKTGIIPQSFSALESSMASYSVGKVDFLTVVTNVITLLEYELGYYEKLVEYEKGIAKLEVLTGNQFATPSFESED
jgi:outer membrane protein TolC